MPFASTDMHLFALAVDIAYLQCQGFAQAQAHRVGCQQKHPVAQFTRGADQLLDFTDGENIRQGAYLRGFDHLNPLPVAFEDVFEEKLQAITIDLDGAPGMGLDQASEVDLQLLGGESIGTAVVVVCNTAHGTRVDIDGALTQALKLQGSEVALVQSVESVLLG